MADTIKILKKGEPVNGSVYADVEVSMTGLGERSPVTNRRGTFKSVQSVLLPADESKQTGVLDKYLADYREGIKTARENQ